MTLTKVATSAAMLWVLAACGAKTSAPSSAEIPAAAMPMATATCTPVPLPTPQVVLLDPAPEATHVRRTIARIAFEVIGATASRVALRSKTGRPVEATAIAPIGTPGPNGEMTYKAHVSDELAARTIYRVFVSGRQTFGGCGSKYHSPSGWFKTGLR